MRCTTARAALAPALAACAGASISDVDAGVLVEMLDIAPRLHAPDTGAIVKRVEAGVEQVDAAARIERHGVCRTVQTVEQQAMAHRDHGSTGVGAGNALETGDRALKEGARAFGARDHVVGVP